MDVDEDTHVCLRCQSTIIGLDNYIDHKKNICPVSRNKQILNTLPSEVDICTYLKNNLPVTGKENTVTTVTTNVSTPTPTVTTTSGENARNESDSVTTDFQLRPDDFFSSLELQCNKGQPKSNALSSNGNFEKQSWLKDNNLGFLDFDFGSFAANNKAGPDAMGCAGDEEGLEVTNCTISDADSVASGDENLHPPSSHTGGKWKPGSPPVGLQWKQSSSANCSQTTSGSQWRQGLQTTISPPPPTHTKGKWLPGKRLDRGYFTQDEENDSPQSSVKFSANTNQKNSKNVFPKVMKKGRKKSQPKIKKNKLCSSRKVETVKEDLKMIRKYLCSPCQFSTNNPSRFSQHIYTYEHNLKSQKQSELRAKLILDNVDILTKHLPLQCTLCSFYFNTFEHFMSHLSSAVHKANMACLSGSCQCRICKFTTTDNEALIKHFSDVSHSETLKLVNCKNPLTLNAVRKRNLKKINLIVEKTKKKNSIWKCFICDFAVDQREKLREHMEMVHKLVSNDAETTESNPGEIIEKSQHVELELNSELVNLPAELPTGNESVKQATRGKGLRYCKHCDQFVGDLFDLRRHLKDNHPETLLPCAHCEDIFAFQVDLDTHINKSHIDEFGQKPGEDSSTINSCHLCSYKSSYKYKLFVHQAVHHPDKDEEINAEVGLDENDESAEPVSSKRKKKKKKRIFRCVFCLKGYLRKSVLETHLMSHTNEKPYPCDICDMGFSNRGSLSAHMRGHVSDRNNVCVLCGYCAIKPSILKRHMSKHYDYPKPFMCAVCGVAYKERWQLRYHEKRHNGTAKDIKCHYEGCEMAFRHDSELRIHTRVHTDERPYLCDTCGYRARTQQQMRRHQRRHTGLKPFLCQHCPYTARLNSHLRRHVRIHSGAKPYRCPYCKYTCNNHENIRKHVLHTKKHVGLKLYPCKLCAFSTNDSGQFRSHVQKQHADSSDAAEVAEMLAVVYDPALHDVKVTEPEDQEPEIKVLDNNYNKQKNRKCIKPRDILNVKDNQPTMGLKVHKRTKFTYDEPKEEEEGVNENEGGVVVLPYVSERKVGGGRYADLTVGAGQIVVPSGDCPVVSEIFEEMIRNDAVTPSFYTTVQASNVTHNGTPVYIYMPM